MKTLRDMAHDAAVDVCSQFIGPVGNEVLAEHWEIRDVIAKEVERIAFLFGREVLRQAFHCQKGGDEALLAVAEQMEGPKP